MSFPAGLSTIQVTGENLIGMDGTPLSGVIIFTASEAVGKPSLDVLMEGSATGEVVNGVMTPITIPTTDAVTPAFTYTITQRLVTADGSEGSPPPLENVSIPASLGASVDVSYLLALGSC